MMADMSEVLLKGYDDEFTCTFPEVLDSLKGKDVNFEMVTSATLRPLRLFYSVITKTMGLVFV